MPWTLLFCPGKRDRAAVLLKKRLSLSKAVPALTTNLAALPCSFPLARWTGQISVRVSP